MIVYDCSTHIWISRLPRIYQFNHLPRNVIFFPSMFIYKWLSNKQKLGFSGEPLPCITIWIHLATVSKHFATGTRFFEWLAHTHFVEGTGNKNQFQWKRSRYRLDLPLSQIGDIFGPLTGVEMFHRFIVGFNSTAGQKDPIIGCSCSSRGGTSELLMFGYHPRNPNCCPTMFKKFGLKMVSSTGWSCPGENDSPTW